MKEDNDTEVSLIELFEYFKKGFYVIYSFVKKMFFLCFKLFVYPFRVLVLNYKKSMLMLLLFFMVGLCLDYFRPEAFKSYHASMIVEPKFNSVYSLYAHINTLNGYIENDNIEELSRVLSITRAEAQSLTKIDIEPIFNEEDRVKDYWTLLKRREDDINSTGKVNFFSYEDFSNTYDDMAYLLHRITLYSKDINIFKEIGKKLLVQVVEDENLIKTRNGFLENAEQELLILNHSLEESDRIQQKYLEEITKNKITGYGTPGSELSLNMVEKNKEKEIALINERISLSKEISKIKTDMIERSEIIDIRVKLGGGLISDKTITSYKRLFPILSLLFSFFFFGLFPDIKRFFEANKEKLTF